MRASGLIGLVAGIAAAGSGNAAILNGAFTINSADIVDLYSATFDGGLVPCASPPGSPPYDAATCTFFNGYTPANRAIQIAQTGTGSGVLNVQYNDATGEITQIDSMEILLSKIVITISGTTIVTADPADPTAAGLTFIRSGTLGAPQNTVDPDEGTGIGVANVFRHDDAPNVSAPDFATFSTIVDSCTGGLCGLIGILSLDGVRYQINGTVNGAGGDSLVLLAQSANNSVYKVNLTTAVVPVPAAGWLLIPAVAAVAARARRRKAA
ncbi:MAG: hypothetical protein FJ197_04085 [Gammaproteobacteria bacterium]|nr:hypothetical protein [Gammaproteobacteria bacterium]